MLTPWEGSPHPPRKWQAEALPLVIGALKRRERGIVSAVMGAGKSVFAAEIVNMAGRRLGGRCIVITAPRQALVRQLAATMAARLGEDRVGMFYAKKKQPERSVVVCCNASLPALRVALEARGRQVALMVCDEAHGTQGDVLRGEIPKVRPVCLVGFTATPFRSIPSESIEAFDSILYRYTMQDAQRDGVLVPMLYRRVEGEAVGTLDEVCLRMMQADGVGPGIVSATSIRDAEDYAAWLSERGWKTAAIHSEHTTRKRDDLLEGLRAGEYRCLAHVSLLAEGVDFPWLRWLCLRRDVQARVRFLQEIGRPLRADPNPDPRYGPKTHAVIMDPNLSLGRHGWVNVEAIGQALEDAADELAGKSAKMAPEEKAAAEAVALDVLLAHLERVYVGLWSSGIVKGDDALSSWTLGKVSVKQVAAIGKASRLTRHIPEEHRGTVKTLVKVPWALSRGQASGLLGVLYGGSRWAHEVATKAEEETGTRPYPTQIQWDAACVTGDVPDHGACLAAGRAGRKMAKGAEMG
jgi:hypothetical protein